MTIEDLGEARFAPFEKGLEKARDAAVNGDGRVRKLFKVSEVSAGSIERTLARSLDVHGILNPGDVASPTEYERMMGPADYGTGPTGIADAGAAFIARTLLAEDRALIDALDDSQPKRWEFKGWEQTVCGPATGGGTAEDCQGRVLVACIPLGEEEKGVVDRGVTVFYPCTEIRAYCDEKGDNTKGYLLLEPGTDEVKLKMEADWTLYRTTSSQDVKLTMTSVWETRIAAGTVIHIVD